MASALKETPCYTPNFDTIFKPSKVRVIFLQSGKRKKKKNKWREFPQVQEMLRKLQKKSQKSCCKQGCLRAKDPDFLELAAQWRCSWTVTPAQDKRAALMSHIRNCMGASHAHEHGTCAVGGQLSLVLTADRQKCSHRFLGKRVCRKAFTSFSGVSRKFLDKVQKQVREGAVTYHVQKKKRSCPRFTDMYQAIWMVIKDLHLQSPFAGRLAASSDDKWHVPFHHKVGVWRLVKKMWNPVHGVSGVYVFRKKPNYQLFKAMMCLPEFRKKVVFHRIVDIGRCPKCMYFEWKCSSVPLALRSIWQEALAKHHLIQIEQKRCYMADRAKAAAAFPHVELYMVISRAKAKCCSKM